MGITIIAKYEEAAAARRQRHAERAQLKKIESNHALSTRATGTYMPVVTGGMKMKVVEDKLGRRGLSKRVAKEDRSRSI